MKRSIRSLLASKVLRIGSMALLTAVLTRMVSLVSTLVFSHILTTAEYGMSEVFMTYANIFMVILGLDIQGIFTKGRLDHKEDADGYLCSSLLMTTVFAIVVVVILNIIYSCMDEIWGIERWTMNLMFLYSYALFLICVRTADYNFFYKYKSNIRLNVSVGVLGLTLSIFFIRTCLKENPFWGRILGVAIPTVIFGSIVYIGYIKRGNATFKKKYNLYSLRYGVPLIPSTLSYMLLSSSDRVMINSMISADVSGIYSLSYTLGMMVQVVGEGMNSAFTPWLFRRLDEEKMETITKAQRLYLLAFSGVTVLVMAVSPEILKLIGSEEYWDGTSFIIWIVFATFLNFVYTLYVNIEFYYKKTALISMGTFMAAVINLTLNAIFLRRLGYGFAAMTTVFAYFAMLMFHMLIVNFILKINLVDSLFVMKIVLGIFIVTILMNSLLDFLFLRLLMSCVVVFIFGVLFWQLVYE